jgi:hypothetical protein
MKSQFIVPAMSATVGEHKAKIIYKIARRKVTFKVGVLKSGIFLGGW